MFAQFYAGMPWTELPLCALLIFFATFTSVIVRMTVYARRGELQEMARLPLDDGGEVRS
jgi:hypothetical protein